MLYNSPLNALSKSDGSKASMAKAVLDGSRAGGAAFMVVVGRDAGGFELLQ